MKFLRIFKTPVGQIFISGLILHLLLSPFFYHPDLKNTFYHASFLSRGVVNIYEYINKNPDKAILGTFNYPPLAYFVFGVLEPPVASLAGGGFASWLSGGNDNVAVFHIFRYLFLMKLPLILTSIATGMLLIKLFNDERKQKMVLLFWFFNPISIYTITLMGQYDIFPVFFIVLSLVLSTKYKKPELAAIALGVGSGFKPFPLLLLPLLAILLGKNWHNSLKLFILGLLPYLLLIFPFLNSQAFLDTVLFSGLNQRLFILGLDIGFGERVIVGIFMLVTLYLLAAWRGLGQNSRFWEYSLAVFLIVLAFTHFHPQWLLLTVPFLTIILVKNQKVKLPVALLIIAFFGTVAFYDDKFLIWGLFSPLDPGFLSLPPPRVLLEPFIDPLFIQSLFHSVFAACALWISYISLSKLYDTN